VVIGFVVWRDVPDSWVIAGGLIIVAGGVLMLRSELPASRDQSRTQEPAPGAGR